MTSSLPTCCSMALVGPRHDMMSPLFRGFPALFRLTTVNVLLLPASYKCSHPLPVVHFPEMSSYGGAGFLRFSGTLHRVYEILKLDVCRFLLYSMFHMLRSVPSSMSLSCSHSCAHSCIILVAVVSCFPARAGICLNGQTRVGASLLVFCRLETSGHQDGPSTASQRVWRPTRPLWPRARR